MENWAWVSFLIRLHSLSCRAGGAWNLFLSVHMAGVSKVSGSRVELEERVGASRRVNQKHSCAVQMMDAMSRWK